MQNRSECEERNRNREYGQDDAASKKKQNQGIAHGLQDDSTRPQQFLDEFSKSQLASFFAAVGEDKKIGEVFSLQFECKLKSSNLIKRDVVSRTFTIYSLSTLKQLIGEKIKKHEKADFRVVIDGDKIARFARESHEGIPSPPHYGLVASQAKNAKCLTAGNIFLSSDYKTLIKISNKSGDFTPSCDSLKWLVAILILNEKDLPFSLPDTLQVEKYENSRIIKTYNWPLNEIRDWFGKADINDELKAKLKAQKHDNQSITLVASESYTNVQSSNNRAKNSLEQIPSSNWERESFRPANSSTKQNCSLKHASIHLISNIPSPFFYVPLNISKETLNTGSISGELASTPSP